MSVKLQQSEIGNFPPTWAVDRIDSAFDIQQGKQVSSKNRAGEHQRPFLRTKNVFWDRLELTDLDAMHFSETEQKRLELRPNDLLVCEGGSIGRTALWNNEVDGCLYQNHLHRLRAKGNTAHPQYTVYWLWYAFDVAKLYFGRGNVTTIPNLSQSKLAELPMALPPLPEQQKIAHILSTVQHAIEAQERIIQTTTELKKALMDKLFTEGLRGEPQKQTEIGPVPESWEIKTVGDYCDILNGFAFKSEDYVSSGGIPNFRVGNINWDGTVSMEDCKFLPESFAESYKQYVLNEGDIMFVMVGATRGKLAQIPASILPALMNQNMWRIVPIREGIDRDFLFHHLRRSVVSLLQQNDDQARGFFKKSDFRDISLAIPSLQEQIEIRTALGTLETKLGQHAAKAAQLNELFRTLLHELMTAKTRVHKTEITV
jgi:type I restriction enzyme S subunit